MSLVGFRNWTIGPYIPVRVTYAVLRSRRAPRGPRQLYAVSLLYANAPGLFGGRGEMAMAVPCCPLRGSAACGSESRLIGSLCSVSVVISNGLQPSLEGLGPRPSLSTVGRKPGHDTSRTNSPASRSTVGCKPGHDTCRRATQCQRAQARHVHREVCERIGLDQPIETGEGWSQRDPPVLTVSGGPLEKRL